MLNNDMLAIAAKMSDAELFSYFSGDKFYANPELTKAVCQEVENREAARCGREPAIISFEQLKEDEQGVSCGGRIVINESFLKKNIKDTPGEVLNTILHEGRHEWQRWMLINHPEDLPETIRLMFWANNTIYISADNDMIDVGIENKKIQTWIEYSMQEIEIDARFYAIQRMKQIAADYNMDEDFLESIDKAIDTEMISLSILLENMDDEQYDLLEKLLAEKFKEIIANYTEHPVLPEDFRYYGNIWLIQHVVLPAYIVIIAMSAEQAVLLEQDHLLYDLYEKARAYLMNGKSLESPEQLILIAMTDNEFKAEYKIQDQTATRDMKSISM